MAAVPTTLADNTQLCDVRPVVVVELSSSSHHHRRRRRTRRSLHHRRAKRSMDCSTRVFVCYSLVVRGGDYEHTSVEGIMTMLKMTTTTTTTSNDDGSDDTMRVTAL
jgi:hypothetical protein